MNERVESARLSLSPNNKMRLSAGIITQCWTDSLGFERCASSLNTHRIITSHACARACVSLFMTLSSRDEESARILNSTVRFGTPSA